MYTFDLLKAELLISLANSAATVRKESQSSTLQTQLNALSGTCLEEAKKFILGSKPE